MELCLWCDCVFRGTERRVPGSLDGAEGVFHHECATEVEKDEHPHARVDR